MTTLSVRLSETLEVYADMHGLARVKGAKHGRGWDSQPTRNDRRFICRFRRLFQKPNGKKWFESVVEITPASFLSVILGRQRPRADLLDQADWLAILRTAHRQIEDNKAWDRARGYLRDF